MGQEYRSTFLTTFMYQVISNIPVDIQPIIRPESDVSLQIQQPLVITQQVQQPFQFQTREMLEKTRVSAPVRGQPLTQDLLADSGLSLQGPGQIIAIKEIGESNRSMLMSPRITPQIINEDIWGKISPLMADAEIDTIECNGPEQTLSIQRQGVVQDSPVLLSEEEIKKIIEAISKKTNAPIEENSFKAETDQFVITAVLSQFGGTRFIIHKKTLPPYSGNNQNQSQPAYGQP